MDGASTLLSEPAAAVRERWEARAVRMATFLTPPSLSGGAVPRDKTGMCVLSIIAHRLPIEDMDFLLRVCGFRGTGTPMLASAAKIAKTGHIMADYLSRDCRHIKNQSLFRNARAMETAMRTFADVLRLTDAERIEFFEAVKAWVVADYRKDPNMDPADPDSRRLTVN